MASARVLVVGSLNMDLVVRVERHPRPGETVLGGDVRTFPGGKGGNQAVAAARAGGAVRLLGQVGQDGYGLELRQAQRAAGVDVSGLLEHPGPSGLAFITVSGSGENMIVVSPGANARLGPEAVTDTMLAGVQVALAQLEIPLETVTRLFARARAAGVLTILNAAPARPLSDALLGLLDCLVVNESEAALLCGCPTDAPERAAQALVARGAGTVVITLGGAGALWQSGEEGGRVAAEPVTVVDTTAAGDAFCGALAVALAEGEPLGRAVRFAGAAGALATTRAGAQPSLPERREIEALLKR